MIVDQLRTESPPMEKQPDISSQDSLEAIVSRALDIAVSLGATEAEAHASDDAGLFVGVRNRQTETIEYTRDRTFTVTVYRGKAHGTASSGDLSEKAVEQAVLAAYKIASFTTEDECAGLPDKDRLCRKPLDLDLWHPWDIDTDDAIEVALRAEKAALELDSRIVNSDGAMVTSSQGLYVLGNTLGFLSGYRNSEQSISTAVIAADASGMQRDGWHTESVYPDGLQDATEVGAIAAKRAVARLSPRSLSTRRCPVVFEAQAAKTLIGAFARAISGGALYQKSSFLLDSLGQTVFAPGLSIVEDPFIARAVGSAPFDDEGVLPEKRMIVKDGQVQGYFLSSYSARKLGMKTTGNSGGSFTLTLKPASDMAEPDLPALLKRMGSGLLVTELIGQGVNPVTGDYSRGACGYWVQSGVIQYPVDGITIAGNLKDMFLSIDAVGLDTDESGSIRTGSLLIDGLTIAGQD